MCHLSIHPGHVRLGRKVHRKMREQRHHLLSFKLLLHPRAALARLRTAPIARHISCSGCRLAAAHFWLRQGSPCAGHTTSCCRIETTDPYRLSSICRAARCSWGACGQSRPCQSSDTESLSADLPGQVSKGAKRIAVENGSCMRTPACIMSADKAPAGCGEGAVAQSKLRCTTFAARTTRP